MFPTRSLGFVGNNIQLRADNFPLRYDEATNSFLGGEMILKFTMMALAVSLYYVAQHLR